MAINFDGTAGCYLRVKAHQNISHLYKDFLFILEDLRQDQAINEQEFGRLRKRVLDIGNAAVREMLDEIDKFDITE